MVGYAPGGGSRRLLGDIILVVTGIVWALYNFATRSVTNRYSTPVVLYYQATVGAIGFLPLALIEHSRWQTPTHLATTIACLLALTVLCSIAGLGLYAKGLQHLQPSTAVNLLNLVPIFGLGISILVLNENVTTLQLLGGAVVIAGVTINTRVETTRHIEGSLHSP